MVPFMTFFMVLWATSISWSSTDNMLEKHTWSLSIGSPQHSQFTTYEYILINSRYIGTFFPYNILVNDLDNRKTHFL